MLFRSVPKFLWGEAVKTAAYLINRMPSRVLNYKTPLEMLTGTNHFIVPPKIFGCTCFVHDHRNSAGKLDPRAIKCIFVGYSPTQKGYQCWSPTEKKFFMSMDVTFHEKEPFYPLKDASNGTGSKGENSNNMCGSGGSVLVPMMDTVPLDHGIEGEQNRSEERRVGKECLL